MLNEMSFTYTQSVHTCMCFVCMGIYGRRCVSMDASAVLPFHVRKLNDIVFQCDFYSVILMLDEQYYLWNNRKK